MRALLQSASMPVLAFAIQASLVAGLALLVARVLIHRGPALRIAVYRASILTILALMLAGPAVRLVVRPLFELGARSQSIPNTLDEEDLNLARVKAPAKTAGQVTPPVPETVLAEPVGHGTPTNPLRPDELFSLAYALGVVTLLAGIFAGTGWLMRLRVSAKPHGPRCVSSELVKSAFVAGVIRPMIYFPADINNRYAPDVLDAILRHEQVHVAQRDPLWTLLARLSCAVAWISPLTWIVAYKLRQDSEELCDRLVLESGIEPADYAGCLLKIAESFVSSPAERYVGAGVVNAKSHLSKRISLMLKNHQNSVVTRVSRLKISALFGLALCGAAIVVSAPPLPRHGRDGTPEATVKALIAAYNQQDWEGVFSRIEGAKTDVVVPAVRQMMQPIPSTRRIGMRQFAGDLHVTNATIKGDTATVSFSLVFPVLVTSKVPPNKPTEDVATLHLVGGDWKIVNGKAEHGLLAQVAELGRNPDELEKMRIAVRRTWILSNLKQIGIALFTYIAQHDDRFALSQATLKKTLKPFLKDEDLWNDMDGKPMDVRINPAILGKSLSQVAEPANCVLLTLGPRGHLQPIGTVTPVDYCDGHVRTVRLADVDKLSWQ